VVGFSQNLAKCVQTLKVDIIAADHELCHTPLNGLKVDIIAADHELCHTPLNGLKVDIIANPSSLQFEAHTARCSFLDGILHSRMPSVPTICWV
jgi:hypothetical protein